MAKNKEAEFALTTLNRIIDLAIAGKSVQISGDCFEELTVSVGDKMGHHHISGDGSRSSLIEQLNSALKDLSK